MNSEDKKKSIYVATYNSHKLSELVEITKNKYALASLKNLSFKINWNETGKSFRENALIKAEAVYAELKASVLADDSGLCVPALDGSPGIYSSRFAGETASDLENNQKLLKELENLDRDKRKAYFYCSLVYIDQEGQKFFFSGVCRGQIIKSFQGKGGFGYDPLFVPEGFNKTFSELTTELKNKISHRARASQEWLSFMKDN